MTISQIHHEPCIPASTPPPPATAVYVTNEASGNLTVIDAATNQVFATVPLGKRPRGIHFSRDGQQLFVALSGSPIAGPGVDEDSLPPPDKSADGIGIVDVAKNAFLKLMPVGSDPEEFALSADGGNEGAGQGAFTAKVSWCDASSSRR